MVTVKKHSRKSKKGKLVSVKRHWRKGRPKIKATPKRINKFDNKEYSRVCNRSFDQWIKDNGGIRKVRQYNLMTYHPQLHEITEKYKGSDSGIEKMYDKDAYKYLESMYDEFIKDCKNFEFPLSIYREITIEEAPDFDKIGVYWSYDKDKAKAYYGEKDDPKILIKALVKPSDIDWETTVSHNVNHLYGKEKEIRLKKGISLHIEKIEDSEYKEHLLGSIRATT